MRPMEIRPECYPCLERLVRLTVDQATPDPAVRRRALKEARGLLDREFRPDAIPAAIANRLLPAIMTAPATPTPLRPGKPRPPPMAARMYPRLAPAYGDDLESLLRLAAAGNALDFFREEAAVTREMTGPGGVRDQGGA